MPSPSPILSLEEKVLDFLERFPNELFKSKEMARRLGIRAERDYIVFKQALRELQEAKKIRRVRGKQFGHLHIPEMLIGTVRMLRDGSAIIVSDDSGIEIYVQAMLLADAAHDDRVEVSLFAQSKRRKERDARREGEVVRILERGIQRIVGTVERVRRFFIVVPDDKRLGREVVIAEEDLGGAKEGEKVVVEVTAWGRSHTNPEGRVVEVLGRAGEMSAEVRSVAREYKLPEEFPPEVIHESESFAGTIPEGEVHRRMDMRSRICVTIDPEDAKDFDDAVSLEPLEDDLFRLGVHIADVSWYVREGSALDKEALLRGTSVYFPNGVIPMLPERLSNELCSLRPNVDRLAFSVFMDVTSRGAVKAYEIRETIIRSARRFTYEEVQALHDGIELPAGTEPVPPEIRTAIEQMYALSKTLSKKRMREGSIDFETVEAKFRFDEAGKPVEVIKKVRMDSHRLVEEFMLLANKVVAQHIGITRERDHAKPFLYRVHDAPDPERIYELAQFVQKFGFKLDVEGGISSKALQHFLQSVRGSEVENIINQITLRAMAKAIYTDKNIGHYGLGFAHYSHFTSPIRRYPDLVIHRMLKRYAEGMSTPEINDWQRRLPAIAKQSSDMERRAMEAEREAVKVVKIEYMKRHLGEEFAAVITGVVRYGMFVGLTDVLAEGMVHVRDLTDDFFVYEEKRYALIGRHSGKQYRLGDPLRVKVIRVNPEERQLDFAIVEEPEKRERRSPEPRRKRR